MFELDGKNSCLVKRCLLTRKPSPFLNCTEHLPNYTLFQHYYLRWNNAVNFIISYLYKLHLHHIQATPSFPPFKWGGGRGLDRYAMHVEMQKRKDEKKWSNMCNTGHHLRMTYNTEKILKAVVKYRITPLEPKQYVCHPNVTLIFLARSTQFYLE